jgi:hypothetical protein
LGGTAPSVTGYWIRFRVTAAAAVLPPVQYDRYPYAVSWNEVEIAEDSISGDINALGKFTSLNLCQFYHVYQHLGRRALDDREDFRSYLNVGDNNLAPGQTNTLVAAGTSYIDDYHSASSRAIQWISGGLVAPQVVFYTTISSLYSKQYLGVYHLFLRARQVNPPPHAYFMAALAYNNLAQEVWYSPVVDTYYQVSPTLRNDGLCDFGLVDITPRGLSMDDVTGSQLILKLYSNGINTFYFYDWVLIPYDEMYYEALARLQFQAATYPGYIFDADSISKLALKEGIDIISTYSQAGDTTKFGRGSSRNPILYEENKRSKIWTVSTMGTGVGFIPSMPFSTHRVSLRHMTRYLSMRGDK